MNYAVVVLVVVLIFSVVYWYVSGKNYYTGPRTHAKIANGVAVVDELPLEEVRRLSTAAATGADVAPSALTEPKETA
jgi:uncharacterized protein (UPF0333 family)